MGKRIFITTNWEGLNRKVLLDAAPNRNDTKGIDTIGNPNGQNHILYYNTATKCFQSTKIETDIILIYDETYNSSIGEITADQKKQNDFLLHHSIPNNPNPIYSDTFGSNVTNGQHEREGKNYHDVFKIIFDKDDNKAQRIIEFLFPTADVILVKKLDLLHDLLVPPADFLNANQKWSDIKKTVEAAKKSGIDVSLATDENSLTTFQSSVNGITDPFNPKYIDSLGELRDALLPS